MTMRRVRTTAWILLGVVVAALAPSPSRAAEALSREEAGRLAVEAYHYLYPLVIMDVSRRQMTNVEAGKMPGRGPMNTLSHMRAFPPADFREVVRPNFDTLYSSGWLDLTDGPVVVSVPDTAGRYYLLPMLDMWTDVFASPGKRTTGTGAAHFAVVPPGWEGTLPEGLERIDAPTPQAWMIGRTQTNGPNDYDAVHRVQEGYRLTPLADWGKPARARSLAIDPTVDMKTPPLVQLEKMPAATFFATAAELMGRHPPHVTDQPMVARLRRIGLEPGKPFRIDDAPPAVREALEQAPARAIAAMKAKLPTVARVVDGWQMNTETIGVYGNAYLKRAIVAMAGLGANVPDDAIYPLNLADADGAPLDGHASYVLRFTKERLPPVDAFWSLTPYDSDGFPIASVLDRLAIGDRDALSFAADGSLEILIQHEPPADGKTSNWLPVPKGPFNVMLRLYAPRQEVLDGSWTPPPIRKVSR